MSGFGNSGTFGGQQQPPFGQQQGFGGFGTGTSSSQPPPAFAGGGFGNSAPSFGFGTQTSANPIFGSSNNSSSFAQAPSPALFGSSPVGFANAMTTSFGTTAPPPTSSSFASATPTFGQASGMSAMAPAFNPSAFGSTTMQPQNTFGAPPQSSVTQPTFPAFGANRSVTTFGSSNSTSNFSSTPFGTTTASSPGFGIIAGPVSGGFGTTSSFSTNPPTPSSHSNVTSFQVSPFGSTLAAPSPALVFGASSTIAPAPHSQSPFPVQRFHNDNNLPSNPNRFGSTPFGATVTPAFGSTTSGPAAFGSVAPAGFGTFGSPALNFDSSAPSFVAPAVGNAPFGGYQQVHDESMGDSSGSTWDQPSSMSLQASSLPFGQRQQQFTSFRGGPIMTSIAEQSGLQEASMEDPAPAMEDPAPERKAQEDKLAALKAKLAQKKKKLEEGKQKQRKQDSTTPPPTWTTPESTLEAVASESPKSSLADRNAVRFAPKANSNTRSQLPESVDAALVIKKPIISSAQEEKLHTQLDLEDAVALVGTCQHMCPDQELRQREQEGDIQLLETPQPGTIHPPDWNLRNTAVKRFRRSAADYKLDIPELVRPPDVLERTCSYLEEWVMERDRQGADPRFLQAVSPPPLDVYQFIWDRTRMIRKDFILQNFVGTGGQCDARAVRCHERIARWHAMCEHQLCHIPDFVRMQSQQNIAELGQAMKTLNQFYDDSLGRSTVEVPDENGSETRTDMTGQSFGCQFDVVQGAGPVDYDGTPLNNDKDKIVLAARLIGIHAANGITNTTAEPEMRALYILLTLDNDGGMEVLSYAAELSRRRPAIFHSKPVQLAMEVFKAKHEANYARFFSILRSSSTPYLFACLMFKHVEEMRKVALRTMCDTYGYKRKDTEPQYDHYPLKSLARLLCFESMDEARNACAHYNVTVKDQVIPSSSSPTGKKNIELVFWKRSRFREKIDEEKGIIVPLRPWKMVATIEGKLHGATRLAVCRGEASGPGSALLKGALPLPLGLSEEERQRRLRVEDEARSMALRAEEERQKAYRQQEMLRKEREKAKNLLEAEREAAENKRLAEAAKAKAEEVKRKEFELQRQQAKEQARVQALEEEKRRKDMERQQREANAARLAAVARAEEERKRKELEAELFAAEKERARKAAEKQEQRRREDEARRAEELRLRVLEEEKERKEKEEELLRLRLVEAQKRQEDEQRKRNEEAERSKWDKKIMVARKTLLWRRLRQSLGARLRRARTRHTLSQMTSTLSTSSSIFPVTLNFDSIYEAGAPDTNVPETNVPEELHVSDFLEILCRQECEGINLASMLSAVIAQRYESSLVRRRNASKDKRYLVLLKIAVIIPRLYQEDGVESESVHDLLHEWIGKRLDYGKVRTAQMLLSGEFDLRIVVTNGVKPDHLGGMDVALLVIPPAVGSVEMTDDDISSTLALVNESVPVTVLNLDDRSHERYHSSVERLISACCAEAVVSPSGDGLDDFERSLLAASKLLIESAPHFDETTTITITGIHTVVLTCLKGTLWMGLGVAPEILLERARDTLLAILSELGELAMNFRSSQWLAWPSYEFAQDGVISNYFGAGIGLPICWHESLTSDYVNRSTMTLHELLSADFDTAVGNLMSGAPEQMKTELRSMLVAEQFQRCFDFALEWWVQAQVHNGAVNMYLPAGMIDHVVRGCIQKLGLSEEETPKFIGTTGDFGAVPHLLEQEGEEDDGNECGVHTPLLEKGNLTNGNVTPASYVPQAHVNDAPPLQLVKSREDDSFLIRSKRTLDNVAKLRTDRDQKRLREEYSTNQECASRAFTEKLEAMLHGDSTSDMRVGGSMLSSLLRDAPAIKLPPSFRR